MTDIKLRRGQGGPQRRYVVDATVVVEIGDPVYLDQGELKLATASTEILGIAKEAITGDGTAKITVEIIDPASEYEMNTNADISVADEGEYFALNKATNVYTVDKTDGVKAGTARQVLLTRFKATRKCLVQFVKVQAYTAA